MLLPLAQVLGECRKKYPGIEFIGDQVSTTEDDLVSDLFLNSSFVAVFGNNLTLVQNVAKSAAVSSRYSDSSLRGVIQVWLLFSSE